MDDRGGTYPKLQPDTYLAIIDEAHKHKMVVHAHAIQLADQKAVVRGGADVSVHMVQRQPLDDGYLALLREKKPYWVMVIGLGDLMEVCQPDPFFERPCLRNSSLASVRRPNGGVGAQLRSTVANGVRT